MTRDELKHSGLLDQYVLGLLGPERSAEVERMIEEDPFLAQEVDRLREDLNSYADHYNIAPPPSGRGPRTAEEFRDLDHEMITAMVERNHSLNLWRYVLLAACLFLIGLSGYLFRLKEKARGELLTERAIHAQDEASFEHELQRMKAVSLGSDSLQGFVHAFGGGRIRTYVLDWAGVALLDLLEAPQPAEGHAYYIYPASDREMASNPEVVGPANMDKWRAIRLTENQDRIRIYDWVDGQNAEPNYSDRPEMEILLP